MRLQAISEAGRLKVVFATNGKALSAEAVQGLLKVTVDVDFKVGGEQSRAVLWASSHEDKVTVSADGYATALFPRSAGSGTNRYAVSTSRGDFLLETFFGKVYQCMVLWEGDSRGKSMRTCSLSFDPVHHSLIVGGDVELFADFASAVLEDKLGNSKGGN